MTVKVTDFSNQLYHYVVNQGGGGEAIVSQVGPNIDLKACVGKKVKHLVQKERNMCNQANCSFRSSIVGCQGLTQLGGWR